MGTPIKVNGKPYQLVVRNGRPYVRSMAVTPAAVATPAPSPIVWVSQAKMDSLIKELGGASEVPSFVKVRARYTGKPIPTKRADGDGGTCPFYGVPQHWMREGIDSTNEDVMEGNCGFRRDGRFATKNGYDAHIARIRPSVRGS